MTSGRASRQTSILSGLISVFRTAIHEPPDFVQRLGSPDRLRADVRVFGALACSSRDMATGSSMARSDYLSSDGRTQSRAIPHDVKEAVQFLREGVGRKVTMAELVAHCGVAERTLQKHFRAFMAVSPSNTGGVSAWLRHANSF